MTADVRVAVVGAGRWAQAAHIPGWQRDPRADVVALADVNETVLADVASKFGMTRVTTDYRELLDDTGIDVIDVVTGNQPHFQISWDALSAGKHVLCEKPVHYDYRQTRAAEAVGAGTGMVSEYANTDLMGAYAGLGEDLSLGLEDLLLGDLVAVSDLDARYNMGFRRGWLTVGVVVHGASPLPGHGPGITPILTGPAGALRARPDGAAHAALTEAALQRLAGPEL
jgi:hypothetical protein